jgi:lauroyl/myristoyl acyltransferase
LRKKLKQRTRGVRHKIVYYLTVAMRRLMVCLPLPVARRIGAFLGQQAFYLARLDDSESSKTCNWPTATR